jgi:predicted transcriptional regulator
VAQVKAKYRNKLDIYYSILDKCIGDGQTKTKLLYHCYSSYNHLNEYISDLVSLELLTFDKDLKKLITTSKGNQFVLKYNKLIELIPSLNEIE